MKVLNTLLPLSVVLLVGCTGADGSLGLPRGDRAGRAPRGMQGGDRLRGPQGLPAQRLVRAMQ
jgi:hypothetical protein